MACNPRTVLPLVPGPDRLKLFRSDPTHCGHCRKFRPHLHATPGGNRVCGRCLEAALDILYGELRNLPPK